MSRSGAILVLLVTCQTAVCHELETSVGAEFEYIDNIFRTNEKSPSDDLLTTLYLDFDYKYRFTDFNADFNYVARKYDYRDNTFDDRTDLVGTTSLNYAIAPNRLNWNLLYIRDRVLTNRSLTELPSNEQDRKTFSTGPQVQWNFGQSRKLIFRGSFVDNRAESERSFKSTQTRGEWQYIQQLGNTSISLENQRSNVNVADSEQDYNQQRYSLGINGSGSLANWGFSIGRNTVEREINNKTSGLFYSGFLAFKRKDFQMNVNTNRQLTDSQIGFALNDNIQSLEDNGDGGLENFDIVERTRHEISLAYSFPQVKIVYSFSRDNQDFQQLPQDGTTQINSLVIGYRQSARSSLSFRMIRKSSRFEFPGATDTRFRQYNRRLSWNLAFNSDLKGQAWISFDRRRAVTGSTSYKDETIGVKFSYRI